MTESDSTLPRRIGSFRFTRLEYLIYQISKNSSKNELLKIAQNLHDKEPKSIINLADTDDTDEYIDFFERLEKKETGMEYPFDWKKNTLSAASLYLAKAANLFGISLKAVALIRWRKSPNLNNQVFKKLKEIK